MERIVVGYDGSEHARKALARAAEIANGATLAVVSAANVRGFLGGAVSPVDPADIEARTQALAEARQYIESHDVKADFIEGTGNPGDVLVQEAEETKADLIIVGTRGQNAARRVALGSVSTNVVHHAPCDVLIVR